jgi:hypothetical protein
LQLHDNNIEYGFDYKEREGDMNDEARQIDRGINVKVVIQCAGRKFKASTFSLHDEALTFVANPGLVFPDGRAPWDALPDFGGRTWIDCVRDYNDKNILPLGVALWARDCPGAGSAWPIAVVLVPLAKLSLGTGRQRRHESKRRGFRRCRPALCGGRLNYSNNSTETCK